MPNTNSRCNPSKAKKQSQKYKHLNHIPHFLLRKLIIMLCADSYQSPGRTSKMEKELLRNLKLTAVNNPSKSHSILQSFVTDLSFWGDIGVSAGDNSSRYNKKRGRNNKIPSLQQAMKMWENQEAAEEEWSSSSASSKAVWKTAKDPVTGKTYYYDSVTRKTQWNKVCVSLH
jgi:hypothetical protein